MRDPLPESIDPRRHVGTAGKLTGVWPAGKCRRVLQVVERVLSDVVVEFSLAESGRYTRLEGHIKVELELCCQRCLQPMPWMLDEPLKLLLVTPGRAVPDDGDFEELELDEHGRIDTAKWIEDEIILRIPNVPVHARKQNCDPAILKRTREYDRDADAAEDKRDNPFKVLAGWKGSKRS